MGKGLKWDLWGRGNLYQEGEGKEEDWLFRKVKTLGWEEKDYSSWP